MLESKASSLADQPLPIPFKASVLKRLAQLTQFDLRSMMLLCVAAALGTLWYQDRKELEKRIQALEGPRVLPTVTGTSWGVEQVTGKPNTPNNGDHVSAWASATPDGQPEWLELSYARRVSPYELVIYESYNPGAVSKVTAFDASGIEQVIWQGVDPTVSGKDVAIFRIPVTSPITTDRIRVYIDSDKFPGWNEIDAVGMHYGWWQTQWAEKATASSCYNSGIIYSSFMRR